MPTAWVMDPDREPMIAVRMNDQPLPTVHGFPARLIVPGLYGYVSATKWLAELELTTLESFDGYWVPLGWSKEAPILTQSRIDTPLGGSAPAPCPSRGSPGRPTAGSARSRSASTGRGTRRSCRSPISDATWVQWVLDWPATPGQHTHPGPRHRRDRPDPDRPGQPARPGRGQGLAHAEHHGRLRTVPRPNSV